jgi:murein L,D-transpeptidase YcbB/YkuD
MKKIICFFIVLLALGCKKQPDGKPITSKSLQQTEPGSVAFDSAIVIKDNSKLLTAFYRAQSFHTYWTQENRRQAAIDVISEAGTEGLDAKDYSLLRLRIFERKYKLLSKKDIVGFDVLLTYSLQKYLSHLAFGKLNPLELYQNWDLKRPNTDINKILMAGVSGDSLKKVADKLEPQHVVYKRLKKALLYLDTFSNEKLPPIAITEKIRRNDSSAVVIAIKRRLIFWRDLRKPGSLTNIYDKVTANAMRKFQLRHGLDPDGVIGAGTVAALNFSKAQRREQIIANLERWRWFPREMGNEYVIVNIPAYSLRVIKDNDTVDTRRVVVGKEKRRTPVLTSTFSDIILNPTWTVPPTIIKEDLGPDAAKDTSYFTKRRLTIYDSQNHIISPKRWNSAKPNNYRYVQRPGDDNSLGNVKFNFPNHFTVYLHDTNHRDFFGLNDRSLSSGCVRVQDPLPLAAELIADEKNWSLDKINEVIASKTTTYIKLKRKINIHQLYWTAWMNKRNELEFRADIYNMDDDLYDRLRQ